MENFVIDSTLKLWFGFMAALGAGFAGFIIYSIKKISYISKQVISSVDTTNQNTKLIDKLTNSIDSNNKLTVALCAWALKQDFKYFLKQKYCSLDDRNSLQILFVEYKKNGGNGVIENLYYKVLDLPHEKNKGIKNGK